MNSILESTTTTSTDTATTTYNNNRSNTSNSPDDKLLNEKSDVINNINVNSKVFQTATRLLNEGKINQNEYQMLIISDNKYTTNTYMDTLIEMNMINVNSKVFQTATRKLNEGKIDQNEYELLIIADNKYATNTYMDTLIEMNNINVNSNVFQSATKLLNIGKIDQNEYELLIIADNKFYTEEYLQINEDIANKVESIFGKKWILNEENDRYSEEEEDIHNINKSVKSRQQVFSSIRKIFKRHNSSFENNTSISELKKKAIHNDSEPIIDKIRINRIESSESSLIITQEQMMTVASWLDPSKCNRKWNLKYSLRRDGTSLKTLLHNCKLDSQNNYTISHQPCLILIEDSWGYVFGGYISQGFENRPSYYGNGECFIFSLVPTPAVYKWTGCNNLFVLSNNELLAMGGGGEGFGFQLDNELNIGISNKSSTFNNQQLSSSEFFKCLNAEVWMLGDLSDNFLI